MEEEKLLLIVMGQNFGQGLRGGTSQAVDNIYAAPLEIYGIKQEKTNWF